jgi:hypothetical protein
MLAAISTTASPNSASRNTAEPCSKQRFAIVLVGSSGKGEATLLCRNYGEAVESLTGGEYYWMTGNFMKYGVSNSTFGSMNLGDIPVDFNELIALCAPASRLPTVSMTTVAFWL